MDPGIYQEFKRKVRNRIAAMVGLLALVAAYGTAGFYYFEPMSLRDAFYMTIISITTVGYAEVIPLSDTGRMFAISTILLGVSSSGIALGILTNLVFEETLFKILRGKHMEKAIHNLNGHYIVCGYGTTGASITEELLLQGETVVVIENNPARAPHTNERTCFHLEGDARQDETLEQAHLSGAKGLATSLPEDADNVFVVLTARALNPDLRIVSRYKDADTQKKLLTAGANHAISPYQMGGQRLALAAANPILMEFIDKPIRQKGMLIHFVQVDVPEMAPIIGKALKNSLIREQSMGALLVGLVQKNGETVFNPGPDFRLDSVQQLLILGDDEQIKSLRLYLGH
ncbi:potassium channel family protein [Acanthopleuribacter pedis]|uniref:NAD-binding protein n=1 Tax=Acanthopleuribacter pedis TaxID=442870 RepID=A0A8J7QKM9_9BACT|nr:potassium channel protein [Acanthopleuribacter pedis]MBO1322781.1 NAD-binding protein [Acanthopleuribacter pedis]